MTLFPILVSSICDQSKVTTLPVLKVVDTVTLLSHIQSTYRQQLMLCCLTNSVVVQRSSRIFRHFPFDSQEGRKSSWRRIPRLEEHCCRSTLHHFLEAARRYQGFFHQCRWWWGCFLQQQWLLPAQYWWWPSGPLIWPGHLYREKERGWSYMGKIRSLVYLNLPENAMRMVCIISPSSEAYGESACI